MPKYKEKKKYNVQQEKKAKEKKNNKQTVSLKTNHSLTKMDFVTS